MLVDLFENMERYIKELYKCIFNCSDEVVKAKSRHDTADLVKEIKRKYSRPAKIKEGDSEYWMKFVAYLRHSSVHQSGEFDENKLF